jgi:hypothetical protein
MFQASKSPVSKSPVSKSPASKSPTICFKKDKSATAFMLLGHGCDYVDQPECTVPTDWVYATSITCGNQLDASSMVEFERDFFGKNPRLYNPCKHYDYLNKQLARNKFDDDHKFNLHIGNHPRRNTYINNYNTFLDNFSTTHPENCANRRMRCIAQYIVRDCISTTPIQWSILPQPRFY